MPKQRMSTADVVAEVACLRHRCLGMRVSNVYDLNSKTYLLKLARSGEEGEKVFLLLESGFRFHTTQTLKERPDTPSNFTLKLRKHVRTRRLEDVRQLGVDRIVDFTFGTGESTVHVILELYSQGNVILTDGRYEVLTLLRSHRDDARGLATMPRHPYPLHSIRLAAPVTAEVWAEALAGADPDKAMLRSVLAGVLPYGPQVADHCLSNAGLQPTQKVADAVLSEDKTTALLGEVARYEAWLAGCTAAPPPGHIILGKPGESRKQREAAAAAATVAGSMQEAGQAGQEAAEQNGLVYDEFEPLLLAQHAKRPSRRFETFDAALDEFFSKVEGQRAEVAQAAATKAVLSKLDRVRLDQAARAEALGREADAEEDKAALIEYNLATVDAAIDALNAALGRGLDWRELAALIEAEKRAGNPVAATVGALHLERNSATLLLSNLLDFEVDSDDEGAAPPPPQLVEVDLGMNAAANARARHETRKKAAAKQRKTVDANARAFAAAEKQTAAKLAQVAAKAVTTREVRQPAWFERFAWFVSSENSLVLTARDAAQAELLVKRHMREGDVFVHAELQGAPVTLIRNATPATPVPPLTIAQAGAACVCRSAAWDAKIVTSAWWVTPQQVCKSDEEGADLLAGSFAIRGRKNFLPPTPLIMGLGFLFVVDEASAAKHAGERAIKSGEAATMAGSAAGVKGDFNADARGDGTDVAVSASDSEPDASGIGSGGSMTVPRADAATDAAGAATNGVAEAAEATVRGAISERISEAATDGGGSAALDAFMDSAADTRVVDFSRYGLAEAQPGRSAASGGEPSYAASAAAGESDGGSGGQNGAGDAHGGRRHLSAAQRRAAKKQGLAPGAAPLQSTHSAAASGAGGEGGTAAGDDAAAADGSGDSGGGSGGGSGTGTEAAALAEARAVEQARVAAKQQQAQAPPAPRGKAAKAKKARDKYAEQDEEDRQLAMEALASAGGKRDKGDKKQARKARRDARRPPEAAPAPLPTADQLEAVNARPIGAERPWLRENKRAAALEAESAAAPATVAEPSADASASKAAAGAAAAVADSSAPAVPATKEAEAKEARGGARGRKQEAHEDEDAAERQAEADRDRLSTLNFMTGIPRDDDVILHALPVAAPYPVLAAYRYKVKLTPGAQKRGKAARQAVGLLALGAAVPATHAAAMHGVSEGEVIAACLGGVKLSVPGLSAAQAAAKLGKKKGKK